MAARTYDDIADWYASWVGEAHEDSLFASITELMGHVSGLRICDLACGEGRFARHLARRGAAVVGVDVSARLLDIAKARESLASVSYLLDDARYLASVADESFDGVLCHVALMDIPDLQATVVAVARVLRPGGWFVFSILHPCFNTPCAVEDRDANGRLWRRVAGYWEDGYWLSETRHGPPGKVGSFHRTLSTYFNALADAGFVVERVDEPRATGRLAENRPIWAEVPAFLAARCMRR
jgi:2-polyprenyl-3-methyl-5-hydroxy-6-metoxy-1,4-benzoquinol methylase